jgi:hypothetical protein
VVHLDDGLPHRAAAELPAGAAGEALEARRDGRQVLGVLSREASGGAHQQSIAGQDDSLVDLGHLGDEAVQQPVEFPRRTR